VSVTVSIANWGPLVIGPDIDDAVLGAVRTWAPTYFRHIKTERNLTIGLVPPKMYTTTFAGQAFLDNQLPAVVAIATQAVATLGGQNRTYEATWAVELATVLRGKNTQSTIWLAGLYEGVLRRLVLQKARGAPIDDLHYTGMRYREVPDATGNGRYLLAGVGLYQVYTDQIVQPYAGPQVADATTYLDEASITEVDITVLGETIKITS
jgi:hypothetical protein